jgi:malonyl-CoA O-methyltransferase
VTLRLEDALPEKRATRRAFDRARGFDTASFIHDEARARMLERLALLRAEPKLVLDLGCATGRGANALAARYPAARVLAVDSSGAMLRGAAAAAGSSVAIVGGDAERLPLKSHCVDLVFANLVLPWCRPDAVFAETARVLAEGGAVSFATLGPDSLKEVREAFAAVDDRIHVHAAWDMHDLGDLAMAAGLAEPVLDVDRLSVTYADVGGLVRDLRAMGGVNVALGRRRGLTGPTRWAGFAQRLGPQGGQRLSVTVELVLGQAFGRGPPRRRRAAESAAEVRIPVDRIGRPPEST